MKKLLALSAVLACLLGIISSIIMISTDLQLLEPHEREKLKMGKSFWEWSSPYGKLSVHYIEKGTGENHLILLHGFRAHTYTWRHLIDPLAKAGFHVWAIDFVGYGLSDKPEYVPYNIDFFTAQVRDFMSSMGILNAHLVGNSLGGGLALNFALSQSDQVNSLTLISALGYPLEMPLYISLGRYLNSLWTPFLGPSWVRKTLENVVHDSTSVTNEQVAAYVLPYQFPGGIVATLLTLRQFDNQHLLQMEKCYQNLHLPILLIWGEHDTLIPLHHYEKFMTDFPQAHSLLINNCGHIPQEENPVEVLEAIQTFLEKL